MVVLFADSSYDKYTFYKMKLNLEQARLFRLKQARNITFNRLVFRKGYDTLNMEWPIQKCRYEKKIYEYEKFLIRNEKAFYGERVKSDSTFYELYSYDENDTFPDFQKKEFIDNFVENGLGSYSFLPSNDVNNKQAYIFLNYLGKNGLNYYSDNVVLLSHEITAMYLLEKGYLKEAVEYIDLIDEKERVCLVNSFDFEVREKLDDIECNELIEKGFLVYNPLKRTLSLADVKKSKF